MRLLPVIRKDDMIGNVFLLFVGTAQRPGIASRAFVFVGAGDSVGGALWGVSGQGCTIRSTAFLRGRLSLPDLAH
jgi:hypothetical protein